jgi:hypothetical protein
VIRAFLLGLLTIALLALGPISAQQPDKNEPEPVRLKKKVKPADPADEKQAPKKDEEKKPAPKPGDKAEPKEEPQPDPEAKAREILNRIAKNMESAKDRLKAKDPGDGTQQIQRDIVKDLDELIDQLKNPPQDNQQANNGGGGGGGGKGGMGGSSRSRSRSSRSQQGGSQQGGNPMARSGQQGNEKGGQQGGGQGGQGGNQPGAGGTSPPGLGKLADTYKEFWGEWPERARLEMDAYQKEGYMAKYRDLLKQYYATIAEKGRRPAEGDR